MGDLISPLKLQKSYQKRVSIDMENVLFGNLHKNIYVIQKFVRRHLLNH